MAWPYQRLLDLPGNARAARARARADARTRDPDITADDGSETARVVRTILGSRMRNPTQRMRPDTVEPPPPVVVKHPLQPFVDRLHARIYALGVPVARWRIVDDRSEPIAAFSDDQVLELAADNKQLL